MCSLSSFKNQETLQSLWSAGRGAHLGCGAVGTVVRLGRCFHSHVPQPSLLSTSPVCPCNEYGAVTLMDLKVNLKLLRADVGRSCFQKACKEKKCSWILKSIGLLAVKTNFMLYWTMTFNMITEKSIKQIIHHLLICLETHMHKM